MSTIVEKLYLLISCYQKNTKHQNRNTARQLDALHQLCHGSDFKALELLGKVTSQ
jgi:hypothetical protein